VSVHGYAPHDICGFYRQSGTLVPMSTADASYAWLQMTNLSTLTAGFIPPALHTVIPRWLQRRGQSARRAPRCTVPSLQTQPAAAPTFPRRPSTGTPRQPSLAASEGAQPPPACDIEPPSRCHHGVPAVQLYPSPQQYFKQTRPFGRSAASETSSSPSPAVSRSNCSSLKLHTDHSSKCQLPMHQLRRHRESLSLQTQCPPPRSAPSPCRSEGPPPGKGLLTSLRHCAAAAAQGPQVMHPLSRGGSGCNWLVLIGTLLAER
jgi:hypothetical protein